MQSPAPFPYDGHDALRQPIVEALTQAVDPEIAMSIVDVGLVSGVTWTAEKLHVLLTVTSADCPVGDLLL